MNDGSSVAGVIVMLSVDDLRSLVRDAVAELLADKLVAASPQGGEITRVNFDTRAAATYLGITPGALRQHVRRGNIKPDHFGQRGGGMKSSLFRRATLDAFVRREDRKVATKVGAP